MPPPMLGTIGFRRELYIGAALRKEKNKDTESFITRIMHTSGLLQMIFPMEKAY